LVVGTVLATALGVGLFTSFGTGAHGAPAVGAAAPTFSLPRLGGGETVGLSDDGSPAVLVFFASWCTPCRAEVPAIAAVYRAQGSGRRVSVIGVDGLDPTNKALAFVRGSHVTFPVAVDADYQVTEGLYYFDGDPDAVFVNANGTIAHIVHGPITAAELVTWERRLS
jgi:peroxiredoxin